MGDLKLITTQKSAAFVGLVKMVAVDAIRDWAMITLKIIFEISRDKSRWMKHEVFTNQPTPVGETVRETMRT